MDFHLPLFFTTWLSAITLPLPTRNIHFGSIPDPRIPCIALSTFFAVALDRFGARRATRIFGTRESTCRQVDSHADGREGLEVYHLKETENQPLRVRFRFTSSFASILHSKDLHKVVEQHHTSRKAKQRAERALKAR